MREFNHLAKLLRDGRTEAGLTQAALAAKLGDIHSQFVSNWERGLCAPPEHSLQKVISILKINREQLVDAMVSDSKEQIRSKIYHKRRKAS